MQETQRKRRNQLKTPSWFNIWLAYGLTFFGILVLPWLILRMFALSRSLIITISMLISIIPLFPTIQVILLKKNQTTLPMFLKTYTAEFSTLYLQIILFILTVPFVAILVAGYLAIALLIAAMIAWFIVGLQQIGLDIGRKMLRGDMLILLWITIGLTVSVGISYLLKKLLEKFGESYISLWLNQIVKVREFFLIDTIE